MLCQRCGKNDALIHLTEINDGQVQSLWLCPGCARRHKEERRASTPDDEPAFDPFTLGGEGDGSPAHEASLADFLGRDGLLHRNLDPDGLHTCPVCGYSVEEFLRSNRLGCSGCYRAFEPNIRPLLARHHGRTIHLGKVPLSGGAQAPSILAERTRVRVALDRAVAEEDYEEAARLRDQLKAMQDAVDGAGGRESGASPAETGPDSPDGGEADHE